MHAVYNFYVLLDLCNFCDIIKKWVEKLWSVYISL